LFIAVVVRRLDVQDPDASTPPWWAALTSEGSGEGPASALGETNAVFKIAVPFKVLLWDFGDATPPLTAAAFAGLALDL